MRLRLLNKAGFKKQNNSFPSRSSFSSSTSSFSDTVELRSLTSNEIPTWQITKGVDGFFQSVDTCGSLDTLSELEELVRS